MSNEGLKFTIGAVDATAKGLADAMSTARKFSRGLTSVLTAPFKALSSMQTFALIQNVKSIAGAFKSLADTGAEWVRNGFMDAVSMQEFAKRTGTAADEAYQLARRLEEAAGGMLNLDNSVKAANELFRKGFSTTAIETFFRFASQRATSTGEDFAGIVESLSTSVLTGRTISLARLGIVLDDAAKKGNILAAVTKALNDQMATSGVTGNETAFIVNKLAQAWDDATDTLKDLVATSPQVAGLVNWMHELASAAREFLNQNFDKMQGMFSTGMGGIGRLAGGAAGWAKGLMGASGGDAIQKLMAGLAKLPVHVAKAVQYIKQGFAEIRMEAAFFVTALAKGPLQYLMGDAATRSLRQTLPIVFRDARRDMESATKELAKLDGELEKIDQDAKGLKLDEKAAKAARAMADAKVAARDWWRSLASVGDAARKIFEPLRAGAEGVTKATTGAANAMKSAVKSAADEVAKYKAALQTVLTGQRVVSEDIERRNFELSLARARTPWEQHNLKFEFARKLTRRADDVLLSGDTERASGLYTEASNIWDSLAAGGLAAHGKKNLSAIMDWRTRAQQGRVNVGWKEEGDARLALLHAQADYSKLRGAEIFEPIKAVFTNFGDAMSQASKALGEFAGTVKQAKEAQSGTGTVLDQWFGAVITSITAGLK